MLAVLLVALSLAHTAPAPKTVTKADNGATVTIAKHQMLKITLDECRGSCGYSCTRRFRPATKEAVYQTSNVNSRD